MNLMTTIKPEGQGGIIPFNPMAAYDRERDENRRLFDLLNRSLHLLSMECDRRDRRGEDVAHIRTFIAEARA